MLQQLLAIFFSLFVSIAPLEGIDSTNQTSDPSASIPSSPSGSSSRPVSSPPSISTPGPNRPEAPAPVAPTEEYRVLWEDADVVSPDTVTITFLGGVEECNSYRAEVSETDEQVTINLFRSDDVKPGVDMCSDLGVFYQLTVTTEEPVLFKTITQDPADN